MPDILVEVRGSWLAGKQAAFLDAVHRAVVHALRTPGRRAIGTSHRTSDRQLPDATFRGETLHAHRDRSFRGPLSRSEARAIPSHGAEPSPIRRSAGGREGRIDRNHVRECRLQGRAGGVRRQPWICAAGLKSTFRTVLTRPCRIAGRLLASEILADRIQPAELTVELRPAPSYRLLPRASSTVRPRAELQPPWEAIANALASLRRAR